MTTQARIESQIRAKRADQLRVSEFVPSHMRAHEPEPRPCDHHWEWINDHTIRCLRCFECKEGPR